MTNTNMNAVAMWGRWLRYVGTDRDKSGLRELRGYFWRLDTAKDAVRGLVCGMRDQGSPDCIWGGELLPLVLGAYIELSFWCGEQDCSGWLPRHLRELIRLRWVCKLWQLAVDEYLTGLRGAPLTDYSRHEWGHRITHVNLRYCFVAVCHGRPSFEKPLEEVCGEGVPFGEYVVNGEPLEGGVGDYVADYDDDDYSGRARVRIAGKSFSPSALTVARSLQDLDTGPFMHFERDGVHYIHAAYGDVSILCSTGTLHSMPIPQAVFREMELRDDFSLCRLHSAHWVCLHTSNPHISNTCWFLNPHSGHVARVEGPWDDDKVVCIVMEDSDRRLTIRTVSSGIVHDLTIVGDDYPEPPEGAVTARRYRLVDDIPAQDLMIRAPVFQRVDEGDLVIADDIIVRRRAAPPVVGQPIYGDNRTYDVLQYVSLPHVGPPRLIARYRVVSRPRAAVLYTIATVLSDGFVEVIIKYVSYPHEGDSEEVRTVFNALTGEIVLYDDKVPAYWVRLC